MKAGLVRITILCLLITVAVATDLYANQDPATVIEASLQAIGTKKDLAAVRSIRALADCTGPNGGYQTELFSARSSRLIFRQVRAGSTYHGQTNGKTFWTKDEKTGDHSLADERAAFAWRSHDYQMLALEIADRFPRMAFEAEVSFSGKTALRFSAIDELGKPVKVFFDKDSKLLLGFVIQNPFSDRPEEILTVFNEWKYVGRLRLPSKVTATDQQGDFVLRFNEISINKIQEGIFDVPVRVTAMSELLELHKRARADHFNRDAASMTASFSDDFTSVANGRISKPSRDASLERFKNYFARSTFIEWDDITPPVIKVSDDATMAHVIVHKRVRLQSRENNGAIKEETEVFAWVALYRKVAGKWQLTGMASTNTPETDK